MRNLDDELYAAENESYITDDDYTEDYNKLNCLNYDTVEKTQYSLGFDAIEYYEY